MTGFFSVNLLHGILGMCFDACNGFTFPPYYMSYHNIRKKQLG